MICNMQYMGAAKPTARLAAVHMPGKSKEMRDLSLASYVNSLSAFLVIAGVCHRDIDGAKAAPSLVSPVVLHVVSFIWPVLGSLM